MHLKDRARQLKRDIPAVFLALRHPDTPPAAKLLAALAVGYALSPIDLIPDFIPVLGMLDDLLLLPGLVALAVRLIPAQVMHECRAQSEGLWVDGRPKRWICAVPIILLWLMLMMTISKHFILLSI